MPVGKTELNWTMVDNNNEVCYFANGQPYYPANMQFIGTMTNDSCDYANGTLHVYAPLGEQQFPMEISKTADRPVSPYEISTALGSIATILTFRGTLQGPNSFAGRQVFEVANPPNPSPPNSPPISPNFDNCWFQGSQYPPYGLSGGGWFVGYTDSGNFSNENGNQYYTDAIGYIPLPSEGIDVVDYYRLSRLNSEVTTCAAEAGQDMKLYTSPDFYTSSDDGPYKYKHNILRYEIGLTTVKAIRDYGQPTGASREITWGITTPFLEPATQGLPYSWPLAAVLGAIPYTWSLYFGSLPAGLTLDMGTGLISGVPTGTGTSILIVRATDASMMYSNKYFTLKVRPRSLPGQLTSD